MTWCSKIYDIFNGWTDDDDDHQLPSTPATKIINGRPDSSITSKLTRIQTTHRDNPFLERSASIGSITNPTNYHRSQRPNNGLATISNMSLNLTNYSKNRTSPDDQTLSRSYSLELRRLSSVDSSSPTLAGHSAYFPPGISMDKPYRSSSINALVNSAMVTSQVSLPTRKDLLAPRLSTRSAYSVPEYETNMLSTRNNEEIEHLIQCHIEQMFNSSPNRLFPMIYRLPSNELLPYHDPYRIEGGYDDPSQWIIQTKIAPVECRIISDNVGSIYANYFYDQYHYNLFGIDADFQPVVMSIKPHENRLTVILRTKDGSKCLDVLENENHPIDYVKLCKQVMPHIQIDQFENCSNLKAQQFIKNYDEKLETQKFKFGVIYQRRGQTTEEEFFNNEKHGRSLDEFLDIIATRVSLKNFKGYRAGLDVSEQTDCPISYYELYDQKEIMFHVSTLLPFSKNDSSQIQRKRHIGNDIVTIVFQEENTPFHPSMIKSNFLHVFLVIQPVQVLSRTCYKMSLVTRDDVEPFPPILHRNVVYVRTAEQLKPFILSKLINAEYSAYRCRTFSLLQERTRCSFLKTLCENLTEKSFDVLCDEMKRASHRRLSMISNSTKKRYFTNMKKMFIRSNSSPNGPQTSSNKSETTNTDKEKRKNSKKSLRSGMSIDTSSDHQRSSIATSSPDHDVRRDNDLIHRRPTGRSDESLNSSGEMTSSEARSTTFHHYPLRSLPTYYADESDEGLDSMSSADTALSHVRVPYDSDDQDAYRQQLRERSHPSQLSHPWHRFTAPRQRPVQIYTPQTAGIHISEAATV